MPQEPKVLDPTLSARHRFGAALRSLRSERKLSLARLAPALPATPDALAKYEKAERWPDRASAVILDRVLTAEGTLLALWDEAEAERQTRSRPVRSADPQLVHHWNQLLSALASSGNAVGGRGLVRIVSNEVGVIARYGGETSGRVRQHYLRSQSRWLEFGSWIADNQGESALASSWLKQADQLASRADDETFGAYLLMRRAQRAHEAGHARHSLKLIDAAGLDRLPPRVRALLAIRAAQAHAALGDRESVRTELRNAHRLTDSSQPSDQTDLEVAPHCTPGYVRAHEAQCLQVLGETDAAIALYEEVLSTWPPAYRLDEGLFHAHLGGAYAQVGAHELAVHQATRALALASETDSRRTERVVGQFLRGFDLRGVPGHDELEAQWREVELRKAS